ncbi:cell division protein FtsW [Corynebacterium sp. zg-331]|uniref:FtsW/RodA/SpoVE family cell cycle protein n=1 Tax=unclassified Corynebacterium TaxID=2624378 RepID=UPI00128D7F15|nr:MULTISPECIES: putative peptidoglycan glycosyltransferase FtsW [unclassified Corynebacterium]MBC3185222.1 cell division protein FtsW [Corynebacterium sp. zg-331]MPV51720.1 cell division protein [Corynebacterium sp. zg331]
MSTITAPTAPTEPPSRVAQALRRLQRSMDAQPGLDYLMLRITVFLLTGIGLVMVMSSSMTWSIIEGATVWSTALRQGSMVAAGLVMLWLCLKIPPQTVRRWSTGILLFAVVLLIAVLVPGIGTGREEVGSQSWIVLGPLRLQPSEFAKVAIAIFGSHFLANRRVESSGLRSPYTLFAGIAAILTILIMAEGDLGMAVSFAIVVLFVLLFAGVEYRWIVAALVVGALGMIFVLTLGGFRSHRLHVYFDAFFGHFDDTRGTAFQSYQGFLSLADGAVGGVGLGQSRAKWFYLPEARNDFIFAIIGEELGLWGGVLVIILFGILGFFGFRTALRARDNYQSLLAATLTAGIVSQAFINIGYVVGLLPVTGIQLPMISAGGTSAIITLTSMGLLANVARHEPEAVSAVKSYGRPMFDRLLFIAEPEAEEHAEQSRRPHGARRGRAGEDPQERFGQPVTSRPRRTAPGMRATERPGAPADSARPRRDYDGGSTRNPRPRGSASGEQFLSPRQPRTRRKK